MAWAKVKEALPFVGWSAECRDDEELSVALPTVGKSPPFHGPDFFTPERVQSSHSSQTKGLAAAQA